MNKHILLASSFIIASVFAVSAQVGVQPVSVTTTSAAPASTTTDQGNLASSTPSRAIILADVSLYNATLKKTGLVNYTFSFNLKSFDLVDQEAYYRAFLRDSTGKVVFLQSFPTKVSIPARALVPVSDVIIVPQDFKGKYTAAVQVTNPDGLPLATANLGEIDLIGGGVSVMDIKSCMIVGGEEQIAGDSIKGDCVITGKVTKYTSLYTTVYSGTAAAPLAQIKSNIQNGKATFNIQTLSTPGSYQLVSQLYDSGSPVSSPVFTTLLITGQSAKILSVKSDKGVYKKEEVAKLSVLLKTFNYKSGDIFVTAKLEDKGGSLCGEYVNQPAKSTNAFILDIPMTRSCSLPSVTVSIADKTGKVLDTLTTKVVTDGKPKVGFFSFITPTVAGVLAIVVILGSLGFVYVRRLRAGNSSAV